MCVLNAQYYFSRLLDFSLIYWLQLFWYASFDHLFRVEFLAHYLKTISDKISEFNMVKTSNLCPSTTVDDEPRAILPKLYVPMCITVF